MILILAAAAALAVPPPGATACTGCHGAAGTALPSLNGRSEAEITAAMAAFRSGQRPSTVMDRVAKGFSDDETRAIAAWLAGRK